MRIPLAFVVAVITFVAVQAQAFAATATVDASGELLVQAAGGETVIVTCTGGQVKVSSADPGTGPAACGSISRIFVAGSSGDDTIDLSGVTIAAGFVNPALNALYWVERVVVEGYGGDDTLTGSPFPDALFGDNGNDTIAAGASNDYVDVGAGGGTAHGDDGDDYLSAYSDASATLDGDAHTTTAFGDTAQVSALNGSGRTLTVSSTGVTDGSATVLLVEVEDLFVSGGDGNDVLDASGASGPLSMNGQAGNDTLIGGPSADSLYATEGTDSMDGRGGGDWYGVFPGSTFGAIVPEPVSATVSDTGAGGVDTLNAFGTGGADAYTITATTVSRVDQAISYSGVEGRIYVTGEEIGDETTADTFTLTSIGPGGAQLEGQGGNDSYAVTWGSLDGSVFVLDSAGTDSLTFTPSNCTNTWMTGSAAQRDGETVEYTGVETRTPSCPPPVDPPGLPEVSVGDASVTEGAAGTTTTAAVPVTLSSASSSAVTVNWHTVDGTASGFSDYLPVSAASLVIAAGATTGTINVTVNGDGADEPNEAFAVQLDGATGATLGDAGAVVSILDDDVAAALPLVFARDVQVTEGDSGPVTATVAVELSAAAATNVVVNWATQETGWPQLANAPADYTVSTGQLTIPAGSLSGSISVSVLGDTIDEAVEGFAVDIVGVTGATIGDFRAIVNILDDDGPRISITAPPADTANEIEEGDSSLRPVSFTISLSAASPAFVTVRVTTVDIEATAPDDYVPLTGVLIPFAPGVTSQTVTVFVRGDTIREANEAFSLTLSDPTQAQLSPVGAFRNVLIVDDDRGSREISSAGPIASILVGDDLTCGTTRTGTTTPEVFGGSSCGTLFATGGVLYGPLELGSGDGAAPRTRWTPVSQSAVLGSGTAADPYRVVTVVAAGSTGIRLTQTDTYVVGDDSWLTNVDVSNSSGSAVTGILYRALDCYLAGLDQGFGRHDPVSGAISCRSATGGAPGNRLLTLHPLSGGSHHLEAQFDDVFAAVGTRNPLPSTCRCDELVDNGIAIDWSATAAPGTTIRRSFLTELTGFGPPPAPATVTGTVSVAVGGTTGPVPGAQVFVCARDLGICSSAVTNASGGYSVPNLQPDTYHLDVVPPFSGPLNDLNWGSLPSFVLAGGETATKNVTLARPQSLPIGTTVSSTQRGTATTGVPTVVIFDPVTLTTSGCTGGTASYSITGASTGAGTMPESPPGSGSYRVTIPGFANPGHALVVLSIACPGGVVQERSFDVYIDPSGHVRAPDGSPIAGATVVLLRSGTEAGPFTQVPNGSLVMSPGNRTNPDTTSTVGHFGWDVIEGFYLVRASKSGCVSAADGSAFAQSAVLAIPPPVTDLDLRLSCSSGSGGASGSGGGQTVASAGGGGGGPVLPSVLPAKPDAAKTGHAGPPRIRFGIGAAQPPLRARPREKGFSVTLALSVDEAATLRISVFEPRTGRGIRLLPGSVVAGVKTGRTRSSIVVKAAADRTLLLALRLPALRNDRLYRVAVTALDASGESSAATAAFRR